MRINTERKPIAVYALLLLASVTLLQCATMMHGTSQGVGIQSTPTGAMVTIDNKDFGSTPVVANLARKSNHVVSITMEGYQPFEANITRSTSGWVWGNIVFGGLIGLAVDAISGGLYKLTPEQVSGSLSASETTSRDELDGAAVVVTVVLEPDPDWELVGRLLPEIR